VFELGPDQGRRTVDAVQSDPVNKLPVDIQDTTVPGGPSRPVSVRILRPHGASRPLPVIVYLHGADWVFGNNHTHCARPSRTRTLLAAATRRSGSPLRRTPR
jgi:acetyl esterase/lipase